MKTGQAARETVRVEVTHNCGRVDVVRSRDVGKVIEHDPSVVIRHNFCVAILLYVLCLRKQAKLYEFFNNLPLEIKNVAGNQKNNFTFFK